MPFTKDEILAREIARLQKIEQEGISPVYDDFNDFLYDYYPNFSWNDACLEQHQWCLDSPEWQALAASIKAKYGYDFVEASKEGIKEWAAY
jgi:hypothetical protein